MTRRLTLVVGLFFAVSATVPAGADTPTIPPDYLCKPQQTATLSAGAQTATTPLDYLCKPQPAAGPGGADTATIPRDYRCKPQPTSPGGSETAAAPLDYLCKPEPATVSAPAEEQNAENARTADATPHPEDNPTKPPLRQRHRLRHRRPRSASRCRPSRTCRNISSRAQSRNRLSRAGTLNPGI